LAEDKPLLTVGTTVSDIGVDTTPVGTTLALLRELFINAQT